MKAIINSCIPQKIKSSQHGVGMVEVLVAMLLLAIGVLGYVAMQVRAVDATGDALTRTQAMTLLRGLAENIRVMDTSTDQNAYVTKVHNYKDFTASTTGPAKNCATVTTCTAAEMADYDAYHAAYAALKQGIHIDMYACPLTPATPGSGGAPAVAATTVSRNCLVAAWGKTIPDSPTGAATDCMTSTGSYSSTATCVMLEVY